MVAIVKNPRNGLARENALRAATHLLIFGTCSSAEANYNETDVGKIKPAIDFGDGAEALYFAFPKPFHDGFLVPARNAVMVRFDGQTRTLICRDLHITLICSAAEKQELLFCRE
jgi:hypothetical protein